VLQVYVIVCWLTNEEGVHNVQCCAVLIYVQQLLCALCVLSSGWQRYVAAAV
jgi:hypothetical protein